MENAPRPEKRPTDVKPSVPPSTAVPKDNPLAWLSEQSRPAAKSSTPASPGSHAGATEPAAENTGANSSGATAKSGIHRRSSAMPAWLPWALAGGATSVVLLAVALFLSRPASPPEEPPPDPTSKAETKVAVKPKETPAADQSTSLVLDWPEVDRGGASVFIDGRKADVKTTGEIRFPLRARAEPYKIVLSRPGFDPITFEQPAVAGQAEARRSIEWKKPDTVASQPLPPVTTEPSAKPEPQPEPEPAVARANPFSEWLQDFDKARDQAAKEKKEILVAFLGGQWCPPCQRLIREVLGKPQFTEEAGKQFILVWIDLPGPGGGAHRAVENIRRNAQLADSFKIRGVPTVILFDSHADPIGKLGYEPGGPEAYLALLVKARDQHRKEQVAVAPPEPKVEPEEPLPQVPASRPEGVAADEFLKRFGLVRFGERWVLRAEKEVQDKLRQVLAANKELTRKQGLAKTAEGQRQTADDELQKAESQMEALRRTFGGRAVPSDVYVRFKAAEAQLEQTRKAAEQARKAATEARAAANSQAESMAADVVKLKTRHAWALRAYESLHDAPAVQKAIADANEGAEKPAALGPTDSFRNLTRKIDELQTQMASMSEKIPIRQRGKLWFVDVQLNGKKKIEMAIDTGAEILCLPWDAAVEAGLEPANGEPAMVQVADGSTVPARRIVIPVMQVGRFTARKVECTVLPREAGDITPLLGQTFLSRYSYRIDAGERALVLTGGDDKPREKRK